MMLVLLALLLAPGEGGAGNGTALTSNPGATDGEGDYTVVDTGQILCFGEYATITPPASGEAFHGQDAQHDGHLPSYTTSQDGLTVDDNITGLTWMQSPDTNRDGTVTYADKLTWSQALAVPAALNAANYGGYDDWRLPSIKELYSLIDFSGTDTPPDAGTGTTPFIDTSIFEFTYGFISEGERIIDSQWVTTTLYVASTNQMFGVNFADGRIKGYPTSDAIGKKYHVLCVRGNTSYGINHFVDNGEGTVTDTATGLMWTQDDSSEGMDWEAALAWVQSMNLQNHLGHNDWRLPNAKELQSIVDYARSPDTTGSAAIAPIFTSTQIINEAGQADYPFYWTGTTHESAGSPPPGAFGKGVYVAFGRALGYMNNSWTDVHGAGCQRSDPKDGDPADYPYGFGPQGDAIHIFNFVRCVRDATVTTGLGDGEGDDGENMPDPVPTLGLRSSPNPFNPSTRIHFTMPEPGAATLAVYDLQGRLMAELWRGGLSAGEHEATWDGRDRLGRVAPSGVYLARLDSEYGEKRVKITLNK
jgi:hypothetical protein